jgi:AcrR family transcriptional regulator
MSDDRRADILAAFVKLVSRFGLDKTTMQDIANELGISVGVIYKDFKNKDDLIGAYCETTYRQFMEMCNQYINDEAPADQVLHDYTVGMFRNSGEVAKKDRGLWQVLSGEETFRYFRNNASKRLEFSREINMVTARILERGVREGVFTIEGDAVKTADLFNKAFADYGKQLFLEEQDLESVLQGVEDMYQFLLRALKKTG